MRDDPEQKVHFQREVSIHVARVETRKVSDQAHLSLDNTISGKTCRNCGKLVIVMQSVGLGHGKSS